jgi:hypothetical protein
MNTTEEITSASQMENAPAQTLHAQRSDAPRSLTIVAEPVPAPDSSTSGLQNLLNQGAYRVKEERALIQRRTVEPAGAGALQSADSTYACVLSAPPAVAGACFGQRMRNGKIARLPKLERDLVNKLLHNHVPYSKIVWALSERGITVTERNVSNWRTRGGYREWSAEQENQLRLSHLQDHLTDYLRQHDAQQLPEVGLQVASTQLTSLLMNPQTAAPLLADPDKYASIVNSLDKCSVRLAELQKERYETVRRAGIRDTVPHFRRQEAKDVEEVREMASMLNFGHSASEDPIFHRNELPPREPMPYRSPGPSLGEQLMEAQMQALANRPKQPAKAPSNVAQTAPAGNQTVTHGNLR